MKKINENKSNLVLLDTNAFVHSSFHAYEPCLDKKGNDQRVLKGVIDTLVSLSYKMQKIDNIALVFDPDDGYLYRKSIYPLYKDNRPETDKKLVVQKNNAINILKNFLGLPVIVYNGYEADDAIGSVSKIYHKEYQIILVSTDKDIAQLVENDVIFMKRTKGRENKGYVFLDENDISEEFGVTPKQIPDWLALMGDTADNLPGIDKIGAKTASKILREYKSIEHLIAFAHEIENKKLKEQVINHKDQLKVVKNLATIKTDLEIKDLFENSMNFSNTVREQEEYRKNLYKLIKFFDWPDYYMDIF